MNNNEKVFNKMKALFVSYAMLLLTHETNHYRRPNV
jgi:hypothetical protein